MKKSIYLLALAAGLGGGCTGGQYMMPSFPAGGPTKPGEAVETAPAAASKRARPPVTADRVNEENARDKYQALQDELDREMRPSPKK